MADWTKYADETKLFSADWSDIADGDEVLTVAAEVSDGLSCTVTVPSTVNNTSKIEVIGGVAGESGYILCTITTTAGQTLRPQKRLAILNRAAI